ncbi:SDR family oxidoreductase [Paenibacillus sp. J5C_2022]|uniref:SDR family oxidoreductase n=1 Tax=Paenibacillus sp. J5C2022 TaxID=2977129 RepID=UPI0021CE77D2|nr:SDR family oxidoreductase [Paenibacillus sp. J5C2022]MCU6707475.1 SDR family oxidoreductase [Paenibacillus sp. J5C2022]
MRLNGKVAIVTGAASGMGRAMAELFAREGAKVVVADMNVELVGLVVEEIKRNGGEATGVVVNVADNSSVEAMVAAAVEQYGCLNILVNNAGIMDNFVPAGEVTDELWNKVLGVNLSGPMMTCRAALAIMKEQEDGGVIINNASVGGLFGARGGASYVVSKHGLIGLTKNIAATYGGNGKIRANAIAPGAINTNIGSTITEPNPLGLAAIGAVGQAPSGEAAEVAAAALFLASDEASFVNGTTLTVDGGWTSR